MSSLSIILLSTTLFLLLSCFIEAKVSPYIIYEKLPIEKLQQARQYGARAYKDFLRATENATSRERMNVYEDYFMQCNNLGHESAVSMFDHVYNTKLTKDMKLLLTLGFNSFAARFASMNPTVFEQGLVQLCEKYEMQLQCQLGFGESRTSIYWRIEDLKNTDGNLRILLDRQCPQPDADNSIYPCFSTNVDQYTKPCYQEMLAYNYTRYSAGRRIARIHIRASKQIADLTKNKDLENDDDQFLTMKEHVQTVFGRALGSIAEIEGEKCDALDRVLNCVLPKVEAKCGVDAVEVMKSSILVGYLSTQRREPLASQFVGFAVDPSPKCQALHPNIV
ncbi:unnamed protein product [Caenorhabditis angaria]|uniref:Uncharacterized protein n=1 Tax=Caenorhabditis angaria TaxID=860376 RepID=A0A9P1J2J4_9PELO|nr:unnamed protein product [Caenorhabditis angaria]